MRIILAILALLTATSVYASEKYVVNLVDGKLAGYQIVSSEYLDANKSDPSNPANKSGALVVDDISKYEKYVPPKVEPVKSDIEKRIEVLEGKVDSIAESIKP